MKKANKGGKEEGGSKRGGGKVRAGGRTRVSESERAGGRELELACVIQHSLFILE